jgi:hypothetical protein
LLALFLKIVIWTIRRKVMCQTEVEEGNVSYAARGGNELRDRSGGKSAINQQNQHL